MIAVPQNAGFVTAARHAGVVLLVLSVRQFPLGNRQLRRVRSCRRPVMGDGSEGD